ncbi:hypothetical protein [Microbacterium sediminis]|uniref:Hemagglutinin n=1 Tax=Microbacterium sediminis TaxID=904291 RepID=A0A1B9NBC2_9MICO|nr:hypothetical protein [Microbacterium sediminis]OCG73912.1 hypothetical protein A7J15_06790 [Microbacterium sediminis]
MIPATAWGETAPTPTPEPGFTAVPEETTTTPSPSPTTSTAPSPEPAPTASTTPVPTPSQTAVPAPQQSAAPEDATAVPDPSDPASYGGDTTEDEAQPGGYAGPEGFQTKSLVGFKAGNIISDAKMFASGTMSAAQIQSFLNGKVPKCQSGYVCLKDYKQNTATKAASRWCPGTYQGAQAESAATIISKAARACGVNEQVLLVMLQKEQGLVTHVWPSDWRYTIAMGYACPDNAACDATYYGFQNQIYMAASQLKRYTLDSWFNWYPVGKTSNVRWHPNASCGSGPVLIENKATAALYYYTPYQPNAAALRAGYGTGDSCSAYGNRNFYNYFTDWFGSTQVPSGSSPVGAVDSITLIPGGVRIQGWALDVDSNTAVTLRIKSGATVVARAVTTIARSDIAAQYPSHTAPDGFSVDVQLPPGLQEVCVAANNLGGGSNKTLGCQQVDAQSGTPIGYINNWIPIPGGVKLTGWTIDPDTSAAVTVRVKSNGNVVTRFDANAYRNDIGQRYPAYGANHAFYVEVPLPAGTQEVCVVSNNVGAGKTKTLGCRTITPLGGTPVGYINSWQNVAGGIKVNGWAYDPDTTGPATIRVKAGDKAVGYFEATAHRDDLAQRFPLYGGNHAFYQTVQLPRGTHHVCLVVNNVGAGKTKTLGCRWMTVP